MFKFTYSLATEKPHGHFDNFIIEVFRGRLMLGDRRESVEVAGIDRQTRRALGRDGRVYQLCAPNAAVSPAVLSLLGY